MIQLLMTLSRRRRFFGDEFLYRVRFLRTSDDDDDEYFTGAVQRPLRPCFTPPLTLLFLGRFSMTRSSPIFCAIVRRCRRWARPETFSNILLHVYHYFVAWHQTFHDLLTSKCSISVSFRSCALRFHGGFNPWWKLWFLVVSNQHVNFRTALPVSLADFKMLYLREF